MELGTVIVTGGSSGLGQAVAFAVREAGGTPVVLDLNPPQDGLAFEQVDLSDTRAAEAAVARVAEQPLGRVLQGHGNDGRSGVEGVRRGSVIGTYLHGPLLPKNAWFADWLIEQGTGVHGLAPLDDALEDAAHRSARRAAGLD